MSSICCCEWPLSCPSSERSKDCNNTFIKNYTSIKTDCMNKCPAECNQVSFRTTRVTYKWEDSSNTIPLLKATISKKFNISGQTNEDIMSRIAKLSVFYDRLETTEIIQSPSMSTLDLIAAIGGILGIKYFYIPLILFLTSL